MSVVDVLIDSKIRCNQLLNSALSSTESIVQPLQNKDVELIVSFTTYNKRIYDAHLIVESIAQQTIKPNRLILWLDENEFNLDTIPLLLLKQVERGLDIRFCPNYRSYKKIIPTLESFPESNVITIDDDVIYPYDFIEVLIRESKEYKNCVIANVVHQMKFDECGVQPYEKWVLNAKSSLPGYDVFPVGAGGVFYPRGVLGELVIDAQAFTNLAPTADDVWLKTMTLLQGHKSKKVNDNRDFSLRFLCVESSQDIGLFHMNLNESKNDLQIKSVFDKYDVMNLVVWSS